MSTPKEADKMPSTEVASAPAWFDPKLHSPGTGGIFETATNTLLGPDGQPLSKAVQLARAASAAIKPEPAAAAALDAPEEPKPAKRRDTLSVIADHAAAAKE